VIYRDLVVDGEELIHTPTYNLVFKRVSNDLIRLIKFKDDVQISSKLINISRGSVVRLRPIPPMAGNISVKSVLLILPESITLLPKSSAELLLKIPVDLGVYVGDSLVDATPLCRVKYALYGPPDLGELCRYFNDEIVSSAQPYAVGLAKVSVNNSLNSVASLSKLVLPLEGMAVYLLNSNSVILNEFAVTILNYGLAEVVTGLKPSINNVRISYSTEARRVTYVMRYGF